MLLSFRHKHTGWANFLFAAFLLISCQQANQKPAELIVKKTTDFTFDGTGNAVEWNRTEWIRLTSLPNYFSPKQTSFKLLYSEKGLYGLFKCTDSILMNTIREDGKALYTEDVIEVFLQPDSTVTRYLEYELSPLNYETILLVHNYNGDLNSWQPFEIKEERKIKHSTSIKPASWDPGASVEEWIAEFFIPFELLRPLGGNSPQSGEQWKANLYRIDYDTGEALWTWKQNSGDFHEFKSFGTIEFE